MIPLWAIKTAVVLALLVGAAGYGYRHGSQSVQRKWDAQVRADKDAADIAAEADRLRSRAAAAQYETQRSARAARVATPSQEYRNALHAPICPVAGPLELADVPVPAALLQRLRDAGADY